MANVDNALQEFKFLITVLDVPSSLTIFSNRFVSEVPLDHSGACLTMVLDDQLNPRDSCHCQMRVDVSSVVKKIKEFGGFDSCRAGQKQDLQKVAPALSPIFRTWFKKYLLVSPPREMSEALRADLPDAEPCQANVGRSACDDIRAFLRGNIYAEKRYIFIEDIGPRISEHLLSHWEPAGFEYSVPWDITRLPNGLQVRSASNRIIRAV